MAKRSNVEARADRHAQEQDVRETECEGTVQEIDDVGRFFSASVQDRKKVREGWIGTSKGPPDKEWDRRRIATQCGFAVGT
jgi:hypothetical protein